MNIALLLGQALLTFVCDGSGPVRFGFPLPADRLARGLRVMTPGARLQWRRLQDEPDPVTGRVWVELAIVGAKGRMSIRAGGVGPSGDDGGDIVSVVDSVAKSEVEERRRRNWSWSTGEEDWLERRTFTVAAEWQGEWFESGEHLTETSPEWLERWLRVRIAPRDWRRAGVLPALGSRNRELRERLGDLARSLVELPGRRGRGDYGRSNGIVTNLEFDTALGFARLGIAADDPGLLARAWQSSRHLIDRDLHPVLGLPYRHGEGHRARLPEPGHVWLSGLLLTGCLSADGDLIRGARGMAHGLARHRVRDQQPAERARDYGWPLLELEHWLRFEPHPVLARAADVLAVEIQKRWHAGDRVLRFGEGENQGAAYTERQWLTAGIVLPALRAHLRRRPNRGLRSVISSLERRLIDSVDRGRAGLPVWLYLDRGRIVGDVRVRRQPEVFLLLEGLPERALLRCLRRRNVRMALVDTPAADDPDLATSWSKAARCAWIFW